MEFEETQGIDAHVRAMMRLCGHTRLGPWILVSLWWAVWAALHCNLLPATHPTDKLTRCPAVLCAAAVPLAASHTRTCLTAAVNKTGAFSSWKQSCSRHAQPSQGQTRRGESRVGWEVKKFGTTRASLQCEACYQLKLQVHNSSSNSQCSQCMMLHPC